MRDSEVKSVKSGRRVVSIRVAAVLMVLVTSVAWLAKGSGLKTWVTWHVLGHAPHSYVTGAGSNSLAMRVRLSTDPMVRFERAALPTTTGTAFTCLRFGPD